MSVGYLETRLVGNYIQMWQTSERRTPPPLLPLPPLFSTLNEISPICGGNSVAHPSQNMSDVIPLTSPGSSPNLLPPPTPLPRVLPRGGRRGERTEVMLLGMSRLLSAFTIYLLLSEQTRRHRCHHPSLKKRKKIWFGGEEEKSRVLNQTQTGLRRGAGGGLEGAGYSRPGVRCHWLMGDIHHPVPQWQEAAAHEWDDRFSSGTRQMAGGRKVELKIQRKTSQTRYLPGSRPCHQPHPGSGDANLNWLRRAINPSHKLFCGWSGSIADIFFEKLTIKQSFTPLLIACYE